MPNLKTAPLEKTKSSARASGLNTVSPRPVEMPTPPILLPNPASPSLILPNEAFDAFVAEIESDEPPSEALQAAAERYKQRS